MKTSTDFIVSLKHEHTRLGRMLELIDNGIWWTTEKPGHVKVEGLQEQLEMIKAALDKIEHVVGQIGS
ncbi:hypothetical protein [Methylobacterium longum]|uniref:Uncharacterized protein n=1 Tax=Methylobacterium longum TaxID=767694 RepID=A0ABT8AV58_9HYPH|nr:hypothetical protein [Methylobacterium longum]MDN3573305.1 hypothetical protein [Methylobacterium longum]GJE14979.1 hypothetical protein FOHLNKBM_6056 [Methylobacterium longum]